MKPRLPCVLTINGGSSSIRFAVYEAGETPRLRLGGKIDRIGSSGTTWTVHDPAAEPQVPSHLAVADHRTAVALLLDWLEAQQGLIEKVGVQNYQQEHMFEHSSS